MPVIADFFSECSLTPSQFAAIKALEAFLNDAEKEVFILRGYAGTGKTFLTKGICAYLSALGRDCILCAPTGKAAKVLGEKSGKPASTIHRLIYGSPEPEPYIDPNSPKDAETTATFRWHMRIKDNSFNTNAVYIVDEASMVSDVYSDSEFILAGSGYLLRDLVQFINFDVNEHSKKLIFIGDPAQLPPVHQNISPALSGQYLKNNFGLRVSFAELTDVVRQQDNSGILSNATTLREAIVNKQFNKLSIEECSNNVEKIEDTEVLSKYLESIQANGIASTAIISGTNKKTYFHNCLIHNRLFPDHQNKIACGDVLMVYRNDDNYPNGTQVILKRIIGEPIRRVIPVKASPRNSDHKEIVKVPLVFRRVEVEEPGAESAFEKILLESFVYDPEGSLTSEVTKALFIDFLMRNRDIDYRKIIENSLVRAEYKSRMMTDQYLHCLVAKWGYAFTCHKAQGSEWSEVILDCGAVNGKSRGEAYFRWLYTAITRAKRKLYFYNAPRFTNSTGLSFVGGFLSGASTAPYSTQPESPSVTPEPFAHHSFSETETHSAPVADVVSAEYAPFVGHDSQEFGLTAPPFIQAAPIADSKIAGDRNTCAPFSRSAVHETALIPPITPSTEQDVTLGDAQPDFLSALKNAVANSLLLLDAKIVDVQHHQYCERYTVQWGEEYVRADVFYNGKNEISRVRPGGTDPLSITVAKRIRQLEGISVNSAPLPGCPTSSGSPVPPAQPDPTPVASGGKPLFAEPFKQEFYDRLLAAAASQGVTAAFVRELQWALRINMRGFGGLAVMDFFYNSKEIFTKIAYVSTKKITPELSEAIKGIVREVAE